MKRLSITISLLVFILTSVFAQNNYDTQFDFRKAKWGMTKERVKRTEKGSKAIFITESDEDLGYLDTIEDQQCLIIYYFIKGKLQRGFYTLIEQHSDPIFYIENYNKIKEILTKKYGVPIVRGPHSGSNSYVELYNGKANSTPFSKDHVKLTAKWNSQNTMVVLVLSGDNYKPRLVVEYHSNDSISK